MSKHVRLLWGVTLSNLRGKPQLIGLLSHVPAHNREPYDGEPTHKLLFTTRAAARRWAAERTAFYREYPDGDCCRDWRYRAVRVCETVEVVK